MQDVVASITRPVRELKGSKRITIAPRERRRVELLLSAAQLGFHGRDMKFVVEPGEFRIFVGGSSAGGFEGLFRVE